ncbi:MAG: bile acid:sodium symporter family protein [Blastochloris sp.]|nr:bile acid:sodium symporter family protein [Blastochloris sp.]
MESNVITAVFLPVAISVIMLGVGLSLTMEDFKRIVLFPRAVAIGLAAQLVITPLLAFGIVYALSLPPELAVGLIIVACCPGGPTSNLITYLSRGDVALSVTVSAISNVVTVLTIPLWINVALMQFMGAGQNIQLPLLPTIGQILILTAIPIAIGMYLNARRPQLTEQVQDWVKLASMFFLVLVILAAVIRERDILIQSFIAVGPAALALNVLTMLLGFGIARTLGLRWSQRVALPIEVGIQNGTLAIALASSPLLLNNPTMAIPPAIYSLIMLITAPLLGFFLNARIGRRTCACCKDKFRLAVIDLQPPQEIPAPAPQLKPAGAYAAD